MGMQFPEKDAARYGRPLDGVRVLSLEQMQALPMATQILSRLGAEVVKLEKLPRGDESRTSQPFMVEDGHRLGHTFLRYNMGKQSLAVDIKTAQGRELVLDLAPHFDIVCENMGPGRAERAGLGYAAFAARNQRIIYLSISGFGETGESPYKNWPSYAHVPEAMCGAYEYSRQPNQPPVMMPMTGLGDTATGLYGVIGVLAALRHRDLMGEGQYVDMAMYDSMLAVTDTITNFWSLGLRKEPDKPLRNPIILSAFRCRDGWLALFVTREHQFERLANFIGKPEWVSDPKFATRYGWCDHLEDTIRPGIEECTLKMNKLDAARELAEAGIAAAPCNTVEDILRDPHVAARRMLIEHPRHDGPAQPVLSTGNPIKMSKVAERPDGSYPKLGEQTEDLLSRLLKLDQAALARLRAEGVIPDPGKNVGGANG